MSVLFTSVRASNTINVRAAGLSNMEISALCMKRLAAAPNPPAFKVTSLAVPSQLIAKVNRRDSDALADVRASPMKSAEPQRTLRRRFLMFPSCVGVASKLTHLSHHLNHKGSSGKRAASPPNPSAQQVACIALSKGEMRNPLPQMTSAGPALLRRIARLPTLQQILTINAATTCHQYETYCSSST